MEAERARDGTVDGCLVKVYCLTCGKFIGRAAPGNLFGSHCDKCRNEYFLNLREGGSELKHARYDIILKI